MAGEERYIRRGSRKLRCGYTTGSCAAGAARAAALMLLSGRRTEEISLLTPKGILLSLRIEDIQWGEDGRSVSCAVRKDAGDDPDVTDGILVRAEAAFVKSSGKKLSFPDDGSPASVNCPLGKEDWDKDGSFAGPAAGRHPAGECGSRISSAAFVWDPVLKKESSISAAGFLKASSVFDRPYIFLDGGEGVGRVTRPGLKQEIGQAALNPVPRKMIFQAVQEICEDYDYHGSLLITVSVPEGASAARKTFNPRLGIRDGISILGTTGIVEPVSEAAMTESIRLEMNMLCEEGHRCLLVTPGNYGETFAHNDLGLDGVQAVLCSNFLGETLDHATALGLDGLLFVSHIGKFIKVSGGIMNTHSRCSDSRAELCAACALRAGIPAEGARRILETETTDEAAGIMEEYGVLPQAMKIACEKIRYYLQLRTGGCVPAEAVLFNTVQGELGRTEGAEEMIRRVRSEWPGSGAVSGCGRR